MKTRVAVGILIAVLAAVATALVLRARSEKELAQAREGNRDAMDRADALETTLRRVRRENQNLAGEVSRLQRQNDELAARLDAGKPEREPAETEDPAAPKAAVLQTTLDWLKGINPKLRSLTIDELQHLRSLRLGGPLEDEDLALLKNLPALRDLDLGGSTVTDEGLLHLQYLENLETLGLARASNVTDQGLSYVPKGVRELTVWNPNITDTGLVNIPNKEKIEVLDFRLCGIRGEAFDLFPNLTKLQLTASANIGDAALRSIAQLGNMRALVLQQTSVTDAGMEHLQHLDKLAVLNVAATSVSDAGMNFVPLDSLKVLRISQSKISQAWMDQFKATHAEVSFRWQDMEHAYRESLKNQR